MKIYDCFTFFNELDLLEIRLEELYEYVDYFVLVEARQTHAGVPKRLYFEENKKRYQKYSNKIIHIVVDLPKFSLIDRLLIKKQLKRPSPFLSSIALSYGIGRMKMDWAQRSSIKLGLKNANDEDIVIISDLDEIPNPKVFNKAIDLAKKGKLVGFKQKIYRYFLNGQAESESIGSRMCSYKTLKKKCSGDPQKLRIPSFFTRLKSRIKGKKGYHNNIWLAELEIVENGGWHFAFVGSPEFIKTKIENYSHVENFSIDEATDIEKIKKDIEKGVLLNKKVKYVKIDESFPESVQKNQTKYAHLIKKVD